MGKSSRNLIYTYFWSTMSSVAIKDNVSRQKTTCRDNKWEEYNQSAETKKVYVAAKFSARCQHKEEIIATKKILSLQMKQEERRNFVVTRYLLSQQEIKKQYRNSTATGRFML